MLRDQLQIGGGRAVPRLLFVTNAARLAGRVGHETVSEIESAVARAGGRWLGSVPAEARPATERVRKVLAQHPAIRGIVIIGGHEVVPLERVHAVAGTPYARAGTADSDNCLVWSDDGYGRRIGETRRDENVHYRAPDYPVTRIPDGGSRALVRAALSAPARRWAAHHFVIRNRARPYASTVYYNSFGWRSWFVRVMCSEPVRCDQALPYRVKAEYAYAVLHGDPREPTLYGESRSSPPRLVPAFGAVNLDDVVPRVTFAGCCWSGLTVMTPAVEVEDPSVVVSKNVSTSLALALLLRGAQSVVGPTARHHSPLSTRYGAAPLHAAFWRRCLSGLAPAEALWEAKKAYARQMPFSDVALERARELKTLSEFTCLGLGF